MTAPLSNEGAIPIEETKSAVTSMLMYSYQAFVDAGYSSQDAKRQVAAMVESIHQSFAEAADIQASSLGGPLQKLESTIQKTKELAKTTPAVRDIYNDLLSINAQLKKKR